MRPAHVSWIFFAAIALLASIWTSCAPESAKIRGKLASPFEASRRKVLLDAPPGTRPSLEAASIEAGTALAVLVDESCLFNRRARGAREGWLAAAIALEKLPGTSGSSARTHAVRLRRPVLKSELESQAKADRCILGVSHRRIARNDAALPEDDPHIGRQIFLKAVSALESYETFFAPSGGIRVPVVVAVVDNGIDPAHEDLRDVLWTNPSEAAGRSGVDDDANGYVDDVIGYDFESRKGDPSHGGFDDHGTHVAGLIAARVANGVGGSGVAGRMIRIMSLNVAGRYTGASTERIDEAIRYAADNGANVINISMGAPGRSDTTAAAIVYALNRGVPVVVSAGNLSSDIDSDFYFPASYAAQYPGMVAVAATDARTGSLCPFSSRGTVSVKVAAPGCDEAAPGAGLFSTRKSNRYGYRKGTSQAAPLVTGGLALEIGMIRDRAGSLPSAESAVETFLGSLPVSESLAPAVREGRRLDLLRLAGKWVPRTP